MNPNEKEKLKEKLLSSRFMKSEDKIMYKKAFDSLNDSVFDRQKTDLEVRFEITDMSIDDAIKVLQNLQMEGCKDIYFGTDGYNCSDTYLYTLQKDKLEPDDVYEDRIWDCVKKKANELRTECYTKKQERIAELKAQMEELMGKDASEFLGHEELPF